MKTDNKKELELIKAKQKARNKANNEIIKRNFDRVSVALPKGTKERITAAGLSINGLVNDLVLNYLKNNNL